ncbi:MAG: PKD domain-containing protein [Thermoplasmatales archaeon]|nr:PKD domain-containing protein [Thermoplasmatales archaeon]
MRKRIVLKDAGVLLIVTVMLLSTVAVTADTSELEIKSSDAPSGGYSGGNNKGPVVWDNGMTYDALHPAQEDNTQPLDAYPADDFKFDYDTHVCDVHWIGGYWGAGYDTAEFEWCILIYQDRGDGKAPGPVFCGPYCFTHGECNPVLMEDTGYFIFYNFTAYLPEPCCICQGGIKYWISIYAIGDIFPQSGWGFHNYSIRLHEAVFKSIYFGYPDWTDTSIVFDNASDMCFQLTAKETEEPPGPPVIDGPISGKVGVEHEYTFNAVDPDGDNVKYHIDWDDGDSEETGFNPSSVDVKVKHTWSTQGTYIIKAKAEDTNGLVGPEGTLSVSMPRNRATQRPFLQFLQNFLEQYPILFQLLQRFLRL